MSMAGNVRLNKVIELLEHGQAVFSCGTIPNGNFDEIAALGQSDYDMIILETEHVGFDFPTLRHSLQYLLNRKRIVDKGSLQPDVVPLVRIPPYTRERNAWVIKQTLDAGPFGLVLPHLDSVEGAQAAVRAARYPQVPGATDFEPEGERGWASSLAPTYWGLAPQDYCEAADVWPLDPDGELLLMGIVENVRGLNTLPDILRQVKGIGAIWAGPGDLSVSMGLRGHATHPDVEAGVQKILAMCQNAGVPCATGTTPAAGMETRLEQGFRIVITPPTRSLDNLHRGRQAAGRRA
jgi:4-hydroxy-2-oxoheptanedioate aldolase